MVWTNKKNGFQTTTLVPAFNQVPTPSQAIEFTEILDRIEFLHTEIEKVESITGPSLRTQDFRRELNKLKEFACKHGFE